MLGISFSVAFAYSKGNSGLDYRTLFSAEMTLVDNAYLKRVYSYLDVWQLFN